MNVIEKLDQIAKLIGEVRAELHRPTPAPAPKPTPEPGRTKVKPTEPYAGKVIELSNLEIDVTGLARVFTLQRGQTIRLRNVRFVGQCQSIIEGATEGTLIDWENIECDITSRYGIYLESKDSAGNPITSKAANVVRLKGCTLKSSQQETPLRLMYGCHAEISDTTIRDEIDITSDKANIGLRLHCYSAKLVNSKFSKGTKIGHEANNAVEIVATGCEFSGFYRDEGTKKKTFTSCTRDGQPFNG